MTLWYLAKIPPQTGSIEVIMDQEDEKLAHQIKLRFGTAPQEPSADQLARIKRDLASLSSAGRVPTDQDWAQIVGLHCPGTGRYGYKGVDNSDLRTMLALATRKAK